MISPEARALYAMFACLPCRASAALALLFQAACGLPDRWAIYGPAPAGAVTALNRVAQRAPCDVRPWGGSLVYVEGPIACDSAVPDAGGCTWSTDPPSISVTTGLRVEDTATVHEAGHVAWDRCGVESWDAATERDVPAFLAWVADVNAELAREMGR